MARISRDGLRDAWKALAAALPLLFIALVYLLAHSSGKPVFGVEIDWLRKLLVLELLAIHSFPFLGLLALIRPATPEFRGLKWLAVAALSFLYLHFIHDFAGWQGLLAFFSLTGLTYLGFLLHWTSTDAAVRLTARWAVNFFCFAVVAVIVSIPSDVNLWESHRAALMLGTGYFALSAVIELTGFYQLAAWSEVGREIRRTLESLLPRQLARSDSALAVFWRALVPLAGTVLLVFGPLVSAAFVTAVAGHTIKSRFEWPDDDFLMKFWLPVIMSGMLLTLRTWHVVWITNVFALESDRPWWRRRIVLGVLIMLAGIYLAAGSDFRDDAFEVANYRAFVPRITYASYLGAESLLALALVPLTWWTLTRSARHARE